MATSFSLASGDALSFENVLDQTAGPINDTAGPAVANSPAAAASSQSGFSINPAIAQGIGNALGGLGAGLGSALSSLGQPKYPQYYNNPAYPQTSPALPIMLIAGVGLIAAIVLLRKK